jgi:hypothetical protein
VQNREFLVQLSGCHFFKKSSALWIALFHFPGDAVSPRKALYPVSSELMRSDE